MASKKWEQNRARWAAYKQGIKDRHEGRPPQQEEKWPKYYKSYIEGYNEADAIKIGKYSK